MKDKVRHLYSGSRWAHIEGMLRLCDDCSNVFHFSPRFEKKLRDAILLHDIGKGDEKNRTRPFWRLEHAEISYRTAKEKLNIKDTAVLKAVRSHPAIKASAGSLEKFLYVIDFAEYNREYSESTKAREILLNGKITAAVLYTASSKLNCLEKNKSEIHPNTKGLIDKYEKEH